MSFLSVQNLVRTEGGIPVVGGVSFEVEKGEKIGIIGETGSGKTSLLKMIGGHLQPESGNTFFKNERVLGPDEVLIAGHPRIAYLSQYFELRNNYHIHEVLEMASKVTPEEAAAIYQECKIEHLLHRWTDEVSGGERQRVALARLLTTNPEVLLLDEPFSNLDNTHKQMLRNILEDISARHQLTLLMVSHDASDLISSSGRLLVMQKGVLVQEGPPEAVYQYPANEYCAKLLGYCNCLQIKNEQFQFLGKYFAGAMAYVRPEQWEITEVQEADITAVLTSALYFGPFRLLTAMAGDTALTIQVSGNLELPLGKMLHLKYLPM